MNLIKFFLPFIALANASTLTTTLPITIHEVTSQNMNILAYKPLINEEIIPIDNQALYVVKQPPSSISEQIEAYKGWNADKMIEIAKCESGLNQNAVSKTDDWGIFQINAPTWDSTAVKLGLDYKNSVEDNIEMAYFIHRQSGTKAWVCAKILGITN